MSNDLITHLEKLDRFYEGEVDGDVPLDVLRDRGMEIPDDDASLDDEQLHAKLWEVIEAMAAMGMILTDTDHLTDRELYRYLVKDALLEETVLPAEGDGFCGFDFLSPIGGCSEEDVRIQLAYYADDEEREAWQREGGELPPRRERVADRDRLLPGTGL